MIQIAPERRATYLKNCRRLALLSAIAALFYLKWLLFDAVPDNLPLFLLLVSAEVFNIAQAGGFWHTISRQTWSEPPVPDLSQTNETVDIFITVCNESADIVEQTLVGALRIRHPRRAVWLLDDGPSAEIEALARRHGAGYLTRPDRRGAKAGNLNDALARTRGDFVVIFDADHVPKPDFLERTLGAFSEPGVAFAQTPQVYRNAHANRVAAGAHEQQELFYGPIMRGKNAQGAVFSCGTNVVFRRSAFNAIGGMPEDSITEDLRVSLLLRQAGFSAVYVPLVLAEGIGPLDVESYFSQQRRWARGGIEILFKRRPFATKMGFGTKLQYALGFVYWFTGWAYLAYLILPVAFLWFGVRPVQVPNQYPAYFLPYLLMTLTTMAYASDFHLRFRGVWFTLSSFPVHIASFLSVLFGGRVGFDVTSKTGARSSLRQARWHVLVLVVLAVSTIAGVDRLGLSPAVMNNIAFVIGHALIVQGFVAYALRPSAVQQLGLRAPAAHEHARRGSENTAEATVDWEVV